MPRAKLFDENEVLNKATKLFWKKGYHATSIQDLVDFLGINRGSLYNTYGGKKELFNKAFQQYRTTNITNLSIFFEEQVKVKSGLRLLLETGITETITDSDRKGCFVVNTTTELIPGENDIFPILQENKKTVEALFYKFLLKGVESGEISKEKDLNAISKVLYTFYSGLRVVAKTQDNPNDMLGTIDTLLLLLE